MDYLYWEVPVGLLDRLGELEETEGRLCPVSRLIAGFDELTRERFVQVLSNRTISNSKIRSVLMEEGIRMGRDTISDHRNNRCACGVGK